MSMFYCEYHDRLEDSDVVGYGVIRGREVCDDAIYDIESEDEEYDPKTVLFSDEDRDVLEDPYFELHTESGPF
ncbi:MAG: hypothetical protein VW443_04750 [Pseudomonadales bacterium]|jgi:hypothetical protein